jgi:two-component system sensor histidine kinase KdpD
LAAHRIEMEFDDDLPLIHVDSALVEESLGQLLDNAAKYSPSGTVISVAVRAQQAHVTMSVSDRGAGMTADERSKLGTRSFRSQRHSDKIPGSGLGFWVASTFIGAHAGTIDISSRGEGLGTTASIVLPASWVEDSSIAALADE